MQLIDTLERLAENLDPNREPFTEHDVELAHIELDPEQARWHPSLHKINRNVIECDVDAIYTAANAGNTYARFLILAAARNQLRSAGDDANGTGERNKVTDEEFVLGDALYDRLTAPVPREQAIAMLDLSLAAIELAIEDAQRGVL